MTDSPQYVESNLLPDLSFPLLALHSYLLSWLSYFPHRAEYKQQTYCVGLICSSKTFVLGCVFRHYHVDMPRQFIIYKEKSPTKLASSKILDLLLLEVFFLLFLLLDLELNTSRADEAASTTAWLFNSLKSSLNILIMFENLAYFTGSL